MRRFLALTLAACGCHSTIPAAPADPSQPAAAARSEGSVRPEPTTERGALYGDPTVEAVVQASGDVDIRVEIERLASHTVPQQAVPFTAEPWIVSGTVPSELDEGDLLGSGLALDLTGDGDTADRLPWRCDDAVVVLDSLRLRPLSEGDGAPRVYAPESAAQLDAAGASMLVYAGCGEGAVTLGFSMPGQQVRTLEVPGPLLQLLVLEEVATPRDAPESKLVDVRRVGSSEIPRLHADHDYEGLGGDATWFAVQWAMVPLDPEVSTQTVKAKLVGGTRARRLLLAAVELSDAPGVRMRVSQTGVVLE